MTRTIAVAQKVARSMDNDTRYEKDTFVVRGPPTPVPPTPVPPVIISIAGTNSRESHSALTNECVR